MNHRPRYRLEQLAWDASPEDGVIRGRVDLAVVIPLFPPAAPSGEEAGRRGLLPARLSPRAGLATSRNWKRFRRELRSHSWLVGLLLASILGLVYGLTELQALTPTTAIR
jgi:hypothetical protein